MNLINKLFIQLILLTVPLYAQRALNQEVTFFCEGSRELTSFYHQLNSYLQYDKSHTFKSINSITPPSRVQPVFQIKSNIYKFQTKKIPLYTMLIGRLGYREFDFGNIYGERVYAIQSQAYIGISPQWQINTKEYSSRFHVNIFPEIGLSSVRINGTSAKNVSVKNIKAGLGASLQIKLNNKRNVDSQFQGLSFGAGFTFEHHLKGNQLFGRVYGESIGEPYDRRIRYPTGLYLFYFNVGHILKLKPKRP